MPALAERAAPPIPRWDDVPPAPAAKPYFLIGQDAHGKWIVRESTGKKAGLFVSREAALRFAKLESSDDHFAVVHVSGTLEFDYAAQHL